jgi:hypothetical protein
MAKRELGYLLVEKVETHGVQHLDIQAGLLLKTVVISP